MSKLTKAQRSSNAIKKGDFIYWRWKKDLKVFFKSYVQNISPVGTDIMLELADDNWFTKYPTRVLSKEIEVYKA